MTSRWLSPAPAGRIESVMPAEQYGAWRKSAVEADTAAVSERGRWGWSTSCIRRVRRITVNQWMEPSQYPQRSRTSCRCTRTICVPAPPSCPRGMVFGGRDRMCPDCCFSSGRPRTGASSSSCWVA